MHFTSEQIAILDAAKTQQDMVIEALAGCLAADTLININRAGKGSQMRLDHVVRMSNGGVASGRRWDTAIPTRIGRAQDGVMRLATLKNAWFSGMKQTFELTTDTGRQIRATDEHPFLRADDLWAPLGELRVGDELQVNVGQSKRGRGPKIQYRQATTRFHPHQVTNALADGNFKVPVHRLVIEAAMNNLSYAVYLQLLRDDPGRAKEMFFLDPALHVHHRDHNPMNNALDNLAVMTAEAHHREHSVGTFRNVLHQIDVETIVSITRYGKEETFDIEVTDDPHNFLANGFVVHNTGKTTTLREIGRQSPTRSGCLFAYNGSIAREAKATFPRWVQCQTPHSMAYRWKASRVGWHEFSEALKRRVPPYEIANQLGMTRALTYSNNKRIKPGTQGRLVGDMLKRFCWSDSDVVLRKHCPQVEGLDHNDWYQLSSHLLPIAQRYWESVADPTKTTLAYTHDMYLKQWALTAPRLPFDYVLFDEAQDANPVVTRIVQGQTHTQRIAVGDSYQAIYSWRGAVDALQDFPAEHRLPLTMSFRFGDAIAEVANDQLAQLGATLRITGNPRRESVVENYEFPHVKLCRTNAGAMDELLEAQKRNFGTHLVGGSGDIGWFCRSIQALKAGREVTHPDLAVFSTWGAVQDHIDEDPTTEFALMVKLVEKFGEDVIVGALDNTTDPELAELVISTAHKAKGLQWVTVGLCDDFMAKTSMPMPPERIRLQYVAVTRAIELLDPGPLRIPARV